jgi:hypothetical protein
MIFVAVVVDEVIIIWIIAFFSLLILLYYIFYNKMGEKNSLNKKIFVGLLLLFYDERPPQSKRLRAMTDNGRTVSVWIDFVCDY